MPKSIQASMVELDLAGYAPQLRQTVVAYIVRVYHCLTIFDADGISHKVDDAGYHIGLWEEYVFGVNALPDAHHLRVQKLRDHLSVSECVHLEPFSLFIAGDFVQDHPSPMEAAATSGLEAGERAAALMQYQAQAAKS